MQKKHTIFLLALGALMGAALVGCATRKQQTTGASSKPPAQAPLARPKQPSLGQDTATLKDTAAPTDMAQEVPGWHMMAFPTGNPKTSVLAISKGLPEQVRLNQPFEYELKIENLTNATLNDIVITDVPSADMSLEALSAEGQKADDGSVTWMIGDLGPKDSKTVLTSAVASRQGDVGTCTSVAYTPQLCSMTTVVEPQLLVTKTGPTSALQCDEIAYAYEVCNPGTGPLANVVVTDTLAEGLTTSEGRRTVQFDAGTLEPGECETFTVKLQAQRTGTFESRAVARGKGGMVAESSPVKTVLRKPVLEITKECKGEQYLGRPLEMQITVTNVGDGVAENVIVRDPMPAKATFVRASRNGTAGRDGVTWNLGALQPEQSRTLTLAVEPTAIGDYRSTVTVSGDCARTVAAECGSAVKGIPAILLEVIDMEDPIPVGEPITYVIVVTNQGSAPGSNIRITCEMEGPARELISASGRPYTTGEGRLMFDPLPSLAAKARAEFRVVVRATDAGDVRFKVRMTSDQFERPVEETESTFLYR